MVNFEKPLNELPIDRLHWIVQNSPPDYGALAQDELVRRQQLSNTENIEVLVKETKALKKIAELKARSAEKELQASRTLAKYALGIAVASFLAQVLLGVGEFILAVH